MNPKSGSLARNLWFKKIMLECKKQKRCLDPKCREENGTVKKQPKEATKILFVKNMSIILIISLLNQKQNLLVKRMKRMIMLRLLILIK